MDARRELYNVVKRASIATKVTPSPKTSIRQMQSMELHLTIPSSARSTKKYHVWKTVDSAKQARESRSQSSPSPVPMARIINKSCSSSNQKAIPNNLSNPCRGTLHALGPFVAAQNSTLFRASCCERESSTLFLRRPPLRRGFCVIGRT